MSKLRRKFKWKNIISFVLVGVLLVGAVAGLGSVFNKDTKTISSTAFAVGGINEKGNYVESKTSIYTKDMFECQGLSIEPDFEATGTYKVFYYDSNKNFLGATEALNAEDGVYNKESIFAFAKYARIMITPVVPVDEDGNEKEDFKIRFYDVVGYANDYTISVKKDQKFDDLKLIKSRQINFEMLGEGLMGAGSFGSNNTGMYWFDKVDVSDATFLVLKVKTTTLNTEIDRNGKMYNLPLLYDYDDDCFISGAPENIMTYKIIAVEGDYSYIYYNVADLNNVNGCVDSVSVGYLEIFVIQSLLEFF